MLLRSPCLLPLRAALFAVLLGAAAPAGASAAGTITGHVTKAADGSNVPQYTVDLYDSTGKVLQDSECTDASGSYQFSGVAAGSHYVRFSGDPTCPGGTKALRPSGTRAVGCSPSPTPSS